MTRYQVLFQQYREQLETISEWLATKLKTVSINEATFEDQFESAIRRFMYEHLRCEYNPVKDKGRHSFPGRPDSRFETLSIEFKAPYVLDVPTKRKRAEEQALSNRNRKDCVILTDGVQIAFCYGDQFGAYSAVNAETLATYIGLVLDHDRKAMTQENLLKDFCAESHLIRNVLHLLYDAQQEPHPVVEQSYGAWKKLFHMNHADKCKQTAIKARKKALTSLLDAYVDTDEVEYKILFALQTTFAIISKLIALKVLCNVRYQLPVAFRDLAHESDDSLLKQLNRLENGDIFRDSGIYNLLELDWFSWYVHGWNPSLAGAIRDILRALSDYESELFSSPSFVVGDLFQALYMAVIPPQVRHALGEFYTPEWLAQNTLDHAIMAWRRKAGATTGWRGVDPCCGSGTFLTLMLRRVLDEHRDRDDLTRAQQLADILHRVVGSDLNPLAVLIARVNYFVNIASLIQDTSNVTIPVYVCDATDPENFRDNKLGKFNIIVSNPPWIDWRKIPPNYCDRIKDRLSKGSYTQFKIFSGDGLVGGINLNVSALITHVVCDTLLMDRGYLAFLMPDGLLRLKSYCNWRKLTISNDQLRFQAFVDWTAEKPSPFKSVQQPFFMYLIGHDNTNYEKGVPVYIGRQQEPTATEVLTKYDEMSFSRIADADDKQWFSLIAGDADYIGRQGLQLDPYGAWMFEVENIPANNCDSTKVLVKNVNSVASKTQVPSQRRFIESEMLYPIVCGPDVSRFHVTTQLVTPFPYNESRIPYSSAELSQRAPLLAQWLDETQQIRDDAKHARSEAIEGKYNGPYSISRVGDYTHAPHAVVYCDNGKHRAAVVSSLPTGWGETKRALFRVHANTISLRPNGTPISFEEAHYICGIMNSPTVERYVEASSNNRSRPVRPRFKIPMYNCNDLDHRRIRDLSMRAHRVYDRPHVIAMIDQALDRTYRKIVKKNALPDSFFFN